MLFTLAGGEQLYSDIFILNLTPHFVFIIRYITTCLPTLIIEQQQTNLCQSIMALKDKKCNQGFEMENGRNGKNDSRPTITVLGTGDFGRVLTKRLSLAGYDVVIGSRDPVKHKNSSHLMAFKIEPLEKALEHSGVVFFAIPYDGYEQMITTLGDKLQGNSPILLILSPK